QALWRKYGMNAHEMLDKDAIRRQIGSTVYDGGMIDHSGGHMHPLNLALGEAKVIEGLGGVIYENSPVTGVDQKTATVSTAHGTVTANALLVCGNAYLGNVVPELTARVMPVSARMIATAPLGRERAAALLSSGMCVEDVRYILDYFRLSADHRLIFGGGVVYGGTDPADVIAKLRPNLDKVFPQLADVKIDHAWSGNFALSFSRAPQLGPLSRRSHVPGAIFDAGFVVVCAQGAPGHLIAQERGRAAFETWWTVWPGLGFTVLVGVP
ncbi:MAG: FAD-binding oxidoreductase, partial [Candidatus Devosia euplotis]|nr:FAD-binding oxidoreductase [Candidatus Devosia euplotis]